MKSLNVHCAKNNNENIILKDKTMNTAIEKNMKILYGTTNQAKLDSMKRITDVLGIELIGLNDLHKPLPNIVESGNNILENAEIKAKEYYNAFHIPVFSCDSGLYFDGLPDELQPGTHTRRVHGKELNDEEMIEYYGNLAREHGGSITGRYRNAICFIVNETTVFSSMDISLATEPFILAATPHPKRVEGFPIDSLSKDIKTGKYYYDIQEKSLETEMEQGFKSFFEKVLSEI